MLTPEVLSLGDVVRNVEPVLSAVVGSEIDVIVRKQGGVPDVSADRGQIERVLMDLALHAREAMPEGGVLTIDLATGSCPPLAGESACVVLTVSDSGPGMDDEKLSKIFEPFYTTNVRGRSGLGLSTVYGIIRQTGGHIEAASQLGRGTTFRMCFRPADEKSASRSRPRAVTAENV